jgi:hypothetical protein
MDQELPTQALSAVPHLTFSIFNIAIPNLVAWVAVLVVFLVGAWARLPRSFERPEVAERMRQQMNSEEGGQS